MLWMFYALGRFLRVIFIYIIDAIKDTKESVRVIALTPTLPKSKDSESDTKCLPCSPSGKSYPLKAFNYFSLYGVSPVISVIEGASAVAAPYFLGQAIEMIAKNETTRNISVVGYLFGQNTVLVIPFTPMGALLTYFLYASVSTLSGPIRSLVLSGAKRDFELFYMKRLGEKLQTISYQELATNNALKAEFKSKSARLPVHTTEFIQNSSELIVPGTIKLSLGALSIFTNFVLDSNKSDSSRAIVPITFVGVTLCEFALNYFPDKWIVDKHETNVERYSEEYIKSISDQVDHIDDVKLYNRTKLENLHQKYILHQYSGSRFNQNLTESVSSILGVIPTVAILSVPIWGIAAQNGGVRSGEIDKIIFLLQYFAIAAESVSQITRGLIKGRRSLKHLDGVERLLRKKDSQEEIDILEGKNIITINKDGGYNLLNEEKLTPNKVELKNINFKYPKEKNDVISDASLVLQSDVKTGKLYAFAGESGAGKTTALKLVSGLYDLQRSDSKNPGSIEIGGVDISKIPVSVMREMIGWVPQHVKLFSGNTLLYNLAYGTAGNLDTLLFMKFGLMPEFLKRSDNSFFNFKTSNRTFFTVRSDLTDYLYKKLSIDENTLELDKLRFKSWYKCIGGSKDAKKIDEIEEDIEEAKLEADELIKKVEYFRKYIYKNMIVDTKNESFGKKLKRLLVDHVLPFETLQKYFIYNPTTMSEQNKIICDSFGKIKNRSVQVIKEMALDSKKNGRMDDTEINEWLDNEVSELSGGQKQRIGIGRIMLNDLKSILFFDEPTSALDPNNERKVMESVKKATKMKLGVVVSHRISTLKEAEKIFVWKESKVHEEGTHDFLRKKQNGIYAGFFNKQVGGLNSNNSNISGDTELLNLN